VNGWTGWAGWAGLGWWTGLDGLDGLDGLGGLGGLERLQAAGYRLQAGQNGGGLGRSSACWAWRMCVHVVVGRRRLCGSCCSERRPPVPSVCLWMRMRMQMLAGAGICRRWLSGTGAGAGAGCLIGTYLLCLLHHDYLRTLHPVPFTVCHSPPFTIRHSLFTLHHPLPSPSTPFTIHPLHHPSFTVHHTHHPALLAGTKINSAHASPARSPPHDETFISSVDRRAQGYLCYRLSGMTGMTPMAARWQGGCYCRSKAQKLLSPHALILISLAAPQAPTASTDPQHRHPCRRFLVARPLLQFQLQLQLQLQPPAPCTPGPCPLSSSFSSPRPPYTR
jgi:hypothetical protein